MLLSLVTPWGSMSVSLAAAILGACIGGALAHELTHAAIAELFGCETFLDIWNLDLYYRAAEDVTLTDLQERLILLSPAAIGWGTALGAYALHGAPEMRLWLLPPACFWGVYTLLAGPSDFSLKIARTGEWWWSSLTWPQRRVWGGIICEAVGITMGAYAASIDLTAPLMLAYDVVWYSACFSALVLLMWAVATLEGSSFPSDPTGV